MVWEAKCFATTLDKKGIGKRLREARQHARLSQREMARQLGYKSPASIANKEKGLSCPSVLDVHYLSFYSGLSTDWIINGDDKSLKMRPVFSAAPEVLSAEEFELIRQFRAMSDKQKARFAFTMMRMKDELDEVP